jgi:hypothetical protein
MVFNIKSESISERGVTQQGLTQDSTADPSSPSGNMGAFLLAGDKASLTSTLRCINDLDQGIEVHTLSIAPPPDNGKEPTIRLVDSQGQSINAPSDLMQQKHQLPNNMETGESTVPLSSGETIVGLSNMNCAPPSSLLPSRPKLADLGEVVTKAVPGIVNVRWRPKSSSLLIPPAGVENLDHSWLLPLAPLPVIPSGGNNPATKSEPIFRDVTESEFCNMTFRVPEINVVVAPFNVSVDMSTTAFVGEVLKICIDVQSLVPSPQKLRVISKVDETFIITGWVRGVTEVPPCGKVSFSFSCIPLVEGEVLVPTISVIWEHNDAYIARVGSGSQLASVFVKPCAPHHLENNINE